ncbi:MAG: 4-hydroxy-tetrahydrodipicolinate reductase [Bacteroidales bacterium]|nr:4-hydroxy-tetrahydrodipicolinate reductase [Bacteroidales bacterium]
MKLALLGYGKMGKEIEKIALERGHQIVLVIDINNPQDLNAENLKKADVAIDFSVPGTAYNNIMACFDAGVAVVSGTTGWLDKFSDVVKVCKDKKQTFFYASNYSLGVNIFFHVNKTLAQVMNRFDNYNVTMEEIHHTQKLDAPSGTAITLANDIIGEVERKTRWELDNEPTPQSLKITAVREGQVPGTHIITYDSEIDTIEIKHAAKNRKGFALGAVMAAEFIMGKTGIFGMNDLLNL